MSNCKRMEKNKCIKPECKWVDTNRKYCRTAKNKRNTKNKTKIKVSNNPVIYNILSTNNKYNIPKIYIELFNNTEIGIYGSEPPHIKKEMVEMGYYQEIEKFIKKSKDRRYSICG